MDDNRNPSTSCLAATISTVPAPAATAGWMTRILTGVTVHLTEGGPDGLAQFAFAPLR